MVVVNVYVYIDKYVDVDELEWEVYDIDRKVK